MTLIQSKLISAKEILGTIEILNGQNDININSYDDLYDALKQNLKQTNSILALKSKLESC